MDVDAVRQDTPAICQQNANVYLDGSPMLPPTPVTRAVAEHARDSGRLGPQHCNAMMRRSTTYESVASLLNCSHDEIALMDTESSWRVIIDSLLLRKGDRVVVSDDLAGQVAHAVRGVAEGGVIVKAIPRDPSGVSDAAAFRSMALDRVKLVVVSHVDRARGMVNPVQNMADTAGAHSIPFLLDATESVGQIPVNLQHLKADFLVAAGSGFLRGPQGTGFLFARKKWAQFLSARHRPCGQRAGAGPPSAASATFLARHLEPAVAGTNVGSYVGMGVAVRYALGIGLGPISARICKLARYARQVLHEQRGVRILQPANRAPDCGYLCFTVAGHDDAAVVKALADKMGTFLSTAHRQSRDADPARWEEPSTCVVAALHYYNTEHDIDTLAKHLKVLLINGSADTDLLEWVHIDELEPALPAVAVPHTPAAADNVGTGFCSALQEAMMLTESDAHSAAGQADASRAAVVAAAVDGDRDGDNDGDNGVAMAASTGADRAGRKQSTRARSSTGASNHPSPNPGGGSLYASRSRSPSSVPNEDGTDSDGTDGDGVDSDGTDSDGTDGDGDSTPHRGPSPHMANSFLNFRTQSRAIPAGASTAALGANTPLFALGTPPSLLSLHHPMQSMTTHTHSHDHASEESAEMYLNGVCCNDEEIDDDVAEPAAAHTLGAHRSPSRPDLRATLCRPGSGRSKGGAAAQAGHPRVGSTASVDSGLDMPMLSTRPSGGHALMHCRLKPEDLRM